VRIVSLFGFVSIGHLAVGLDLWSMKRPDRRTLTFHNN
jgi:hypothetical protein